MFRLSRIKKTISNSFLLAVLVMAQVAGAVSPFVSTARAAGTITASDHEGQLFPSLTWSNGNITTYKEGETINFRFDLESSGSTSGQMAVLFTVDDVCTFFEPVFTLGTIENVSGALPTVTTIGSPTNAPQDDYQQILEVTFADAGSATVNYTLTLSDEAGSCNGSSQHSRLANIVGSANGDFANIGAQNVPIPAKDIIELPDILVQKNVDTNGDGVSDRTALAGEWSFSLDNGTPVATDANGQVLFQNISGGTHTVTESNGPVGQTFISGSGTNCTFQGAVATATVAEGPSATNATCTFLNGILPGSITIIKDAKPNRAQDFAFTTTGTGLSAFSLDDDANATLSNSRTFNGLLPGTFTVTETGVSGWDLRSIVCSGATTQINGSSVSITLAAGQNATCTFTNVKRGTVTVSKVTNPANDPTVFPIAISGTGTINGSTSGSLTTTTPVVFDVSEGSYSVAETVPAGWTQSSNTCTENNLTIVVTDSTTEEQLNKTCTITNTKLARLNIVKDAVPNSAQDFTFNTTGTGLSAFVLDDDLDATRANNQQFVDLAPGTFTVTEGAVAGWDLTALNCGQHAFTRNDNVLSITLAAGEDVTCTFTNTQRGSISGTKYEVNAEATTGTVGNELEGWVIYLDLNNNEVRDAGEPFTTTDANGFYSFTNLVNGSYVVREEVQDMWTQIFMPAMVTLDAGETDAGNDFGNFENGSITGYKFNDHNGNGVEDTSDEHLSGWTINLYYDNDDADQLINNLLATDVTDGSGFSFANLAPGVYQVCEATPPAGWVQTFPANAGCHLITINVSGETNEVKFGNVGRGSITVVKQTNPDGDPTQFNFTASYDNDGFSLSDSQSNTATDVAAGIHSVSEQVPAGWDLESATCSDQSNPASIDLQPGESVTCTFTNEKDANIVVAKQTNPDGDPTQFNFIASYDNDGFSLSDGQQNDSGDLAPGVYSVSETVPAGWDLESATCSDQSAPGTISLAAGETVTCTFTNEKDANIVVIKQTDPDGSTEVFNFTASYDNDGFSLSDGQQNDSGDLAPGVYSVSEQMANGWQLKSTQCSDGSDSSAIGLSAGETVTCTFNNEQDAHIVVIKQTTPDGSTQEFNFVASYDVAGFTLKDGESNNSGDLDPGTYSVSENVPEGWDLESAACSDRSPANAIVLSAGEVVTCTFTNAKWADVTIIKDADPEDGTDFTFTLNKEEDEVEDDLLVVPFLDLLDEEVGETFVLDDDTDSTLSDRKQLSLAPGTYVIAESDIPDNWELADIVCDESVDYEVSENLLTITVENGDVFSCTFSNQKQAKVTVVKYNDLDRDGDYDEQESDAGIPEPRLEGWTFNLEEDSDEPKNIEPQTTGTNGEAVFAGITPNQGYVLTEEEQSGWTLTGYDCTILFQNNPELELDSRVLPLSHEEADNYLYPNPGAEVVCYVGNAQDVVLNIAKSNNRPAPTTTGDTVTYTLTVSVPTESGVAFNTNVTDLTPEHFDYLSGSWTASSNIPGHDVASDVALGSPIGQPSYASPGEWNLGTLLPGEVVTLTYRAFIQNVVSPGLYPDIAFAEANDAPQSETRIFANVSTGSSTPFVGTAVQVVSNIVPSSFVGATLVETGLTWLHSAYLAATLLLLGSVVVTRRKVESKGGRA